MFLNLLCNSVVSLSIPTGAVLFLERSIIAGNKNYFPVNKYSRNNYYSMFTGNNCYVFVYADAGGWQPVINCGGMAAAATPLG